MGERQRREQWVVDKTKEIKEQTVRGLEPDIQRLVGKQREEAPPPPRGPAVATFRHPPSPSSIALPRTIALGHPPSPFMDLR